MDENWLSHTLSAVLAAAGTGVGLYFLYRSKLAEARKGEGEAELALRVKSMEVEQKADDRDRKVAEKAQDWVDKRTRELVDYFQGKYQQLAIENDRRYEILRLETVRLRTEHDACQQDHAVAKARCVQLGEEMAELSIAAEQRAARITELTMEVGRLKGRLDVIEGRAEGGLS